MDTYVVFGASPNPLRHANKAVKSLVRRNKNVIPIGFRKGSIAGIDIVTDLIEIEGSISVLLYLGPKRQVDYYNYIINLQPKKIVFNPGTKNEELKKLAIENGISVIEDCALVMINASQL
jgi:uncharacterized protein